MGSLNLESFEKDQWFLAVELLMGDLRIAAESTQENNFDGLLINNFTKQYFIINCNELTILIYSKLFKCWLL